VRIVAVRTFSDYRVYALSGIVSLAAPGVSITDIHFISRPAQGHQEGMRVNFVLSSSSHGAQPVRDNPDIILPHAERLPSLTYVCRE
jgi:hypothetical protein